MIFNIRPLDVREFIRGKRDRQSGFPIMAPGDPVIDQDRQATDAYLAGFDPSCCFVGIKAGKHQEASAFRKQLLAAYEGFIDLDRSSSS